MKFTKEMRERIIAWVETNGLYPQPCGAPIIDLCKAFGISEDSFARWVKKTDFADHLNRARATFAQKTESDIVNSLVKSAKGMDCTVEKEYAEADKVTGELKTRKAWRERRCFPPDVKAAQFVLTNLAPDRWKMKQETTIQGGDQPLALNVSIAAKEGLETAIETGAEPRPPKEEEE